MNKNRKMRVGITHGDTNGIGYEVILKTLAEPHITEICTPVLYGAPRVASFYRKSLGMQPIPYQTVESAEAVTDGQINMINVLPAEIKIEPGVASPEAGKAAFASL